MSLKTFYKSSFFASLAEGSILPFMSLFALSLGATKTLIGLLSTVPALISQFSQLLWSGLTEITKKKKLLVVIGGTFWSVFWIPIAFVSDPISLIILVTIQAFFSSLAIPAWTTLLIHMTPSYKRGEVTGMINTYAGIGSFLGAIIAGFILNRFGFHYFLFFLVFLFGLISKILFCHIHEPIIPSQTKSIKSSLKRTFNLHIIKKNKKLMTFIKAIAFFNFSTAIAGPFFSVYVVENLGGTRLDVATIAAINIITAIIFYRAWGTLIDYLGKKTIILSCAIPVSFTPFVYAISNHVFWIYIWTIIGSMSFSGFGMAAFTYLSDITPKEGTSSYIAMHNVITGLSSSVAPFIGGVIADMTSIWFIFILSSFLRIFSLHFFDKLEERMGFKPKGVFKFGFDFFDISYRMGNFISTYSLAVEEVKREGGKLIRMRNLRKLMKSLKRK
ncbi:MAG: MFS transporter [Candidatus Heimdallarchaeota archaeon]